MCAIALGTIVCAPLWHCIGLLQRYSPRIMWPGFLPPPPCHRPVSSHSITVCPALLCTNLKTDLGVSVISTSLKAVDSLTFI